MLLPARAGVKEAGGRWDRSDGSDRPDGSDGWEGAGAEGGCRWEKEDAGASRRGEAPADGVSGCG